MKRTMMLLASIGMLGGMAACSGGNGGPDGDAASDDGGVPDDAGTADDGGEPDAVEDAEPDADDVPADAEPE